jgi:hypothetical protein
MSKRVVFSIVIITIVVSVILSAGLNAQWAPEGVRVTPSAGNQSWNHSAPDPGGGALISWIDLSGTRHKVYVQKLSPNGERLWGAGVAVSADTFPQDGMR